MAAGVVLGANHVRSLDSILSDEPSVHTLPEAAESDSPAPESAPAEEAKASEPDPQPETGREDDEDEGDESRAYEPKELRVDGLRKALDSERKRAKEEARQRKEEARQRQELQRQLDHLNGQLTALRRPQQPAQQQQPKTEDEYEKFLAEGPKWTRGLVDQQVSQVREQLTRRQIEILQADFEDRHEDARDLLGKFSGLAQNDPSLAARFTAIVDGRDPAYRNPVRFAYDYAKAYAQAAELADPVAYREKVKAEVLAELSKSGPSSSPQPPAKAPPKTLAGARGTGAGVTQEWRGPRSMAEILK